MKTLFFLALFLASFLGTYAQVSDNFSDGDFTQNPVWNGNESKFKINQDLQLQLTAPKESGTAYLSIPSMRLRNTSWEFGVKMNFNPTTSNYMKIYLSDANADLSGDGYYVKIGNTNKNICLYYQEGTKTTSLISGTSKRTDLDVFTAQIKITLDKQGNFTLYSKLPEESDFVREGTCLISKFPESQAFGLVCVYTTTRNEHFFFDDLNISKIEEDDTLPDTDSVIPDHGDVIINEIMAKPSGDNPEYIELYNTSDKTFQLKGWKIYYGDKPYLLAEKTFEPYSYLVLCKTTAVASFPEGKALGVSSFPTLSNGGKLLRLDTDLGLLVDWFEYNEKMYRNEDKVSSGGFSLESIDPRNQSHSASNWKASEVEDGTPGLLNSVDSPNPDQEFPVIISSNQGIGDTLTVVFSKPMERSRLSDKNSYSFDTDGFEIDYLSANYPQGTELRLKLKQIPPQGELIKLSFPGLVDLSGFNMPSDQVVQIGIGYNADSLDVIINELVPNPFVDSNEYLELYNRSDKNIELAYLSVATRKNTDGSLNKAYALSSERKFLYPKEYVLITQSKDKVCNFYTCKPDALVIELPVMPSFTQTSGTVVLINNQANSIVDELAYTDKMYNSNISNKKGVALERIDFNQPTSDIRNWTSASSDSGYGTPGYANSQMNPTDLPPINNDVFINSDVSISMYEIHYQLPTSGNRCRVLIYDTMGKLVNELADNELLGREGSFVWNGKDQTGQSLSSGVYIVYVEIISQEGQVSKYKLPCVVKSSF